MQYYKKILLQSNLSLNMKKCHFYKLKFLWHIADRPWEDMGDCWVCCTLTPLNTAKFSWYHKCIPHFADITAPLNQLKKKKVKWERTTECQTSMDKTSTATVPAVHRCLQHRPWSHSHPAVSWMERGVGICLPDFNKGLTARLGNKHNYFTLEKKCLAMVWVAEKWRHCIYI